MRSASVLQLPMATAVQEAPPPTKQTPQEPSLLLAPKEAARLCNIGLRTWRRHEVTGRIGPEPVRIGRSVRYRRSQLLDWIEAGCPPRDEWTIDNK